MSLPPYTFSSALSHWTFNLPVFVALMVLLLLYLVGVRAVRLRGERWAWWRTVSFAGLGLGFVAVCTMSSLAVYDHTYLWALAAQLTLLISLAPVGVALGDPVGLARVALPDGGRVRLDRALRSRIVRIFTFPVVSAVLVTAVTMVVFFSDLLDAAVRETTVLDLVYLLVLVVGCLAALPLLGAEMLPGWCTEPIKVLLAFVDGLFDAVPGIVVMTTSSRLALDSYPLNAADPPNWGVHLAGAVMLALTEIVALPMFFILFFRWAAHETKRDLPRNRTTAAAQPLAIEEPELMPPWWETEALGPNNPRFMPRDDRGRDESLDRQ